MFRVGHDLASFAILIAYGHRLVVTLSGHREFAYISIVREPCPVAHLIATPQRRSDGVRSSLQTM